MAVESAADRAALLADFGVLVTLAGGSPPTTFTAILDQAYQEAEFPGAVAVAARRPMLTAREADLAGVARGDQLEAEGVTYRVAELHPDGTGMVAVMLETV